MKCSHLTLLSTAVLLLVTFTLGCNIKEDDSISKEPPTGAGEHHEEKLGPEGGHLVELGDEEYHIEWLHDDDEGVLTFIVLDAAGKSEVPIEGDLTLSMEIKKDEGEPDVQTRIADPVGRDADNPKTARFEIADKITTFNMAENDKVTSTLIVTIDGEEYKAEVEHHAHHGHSHGHSHSH